MPHDFIDDVLVHCVFAIGSGAGMKIDRLAITKLRDHIENPKEGIRAELTRPQDPLNPNDTPPGEPRWKLVAAFLLDCCETIGRLAAVTALQRGSRVIQLADLKSAYNKVSKENAGALPGPFCPDFP